MSNFLKSLELQGFKSFATKTTLEFPARITAIVGPNGSGKSNVIDALRWVLGEREAKNLRGSTLSNLIFAGTPKRSAQGFAKVALHFDNSKKLFPIEAMEVAVARRVDRSGTSEFLWNDMEVRLKELLPIFARARLGSRGLNMIGQGESDIFVRSNPEERRLMIEEILGLREFRIKKNQAERRLESSHVNMEKVAAMLEELEPHLRMLRRQKNRFEKRSEIERELRDLEDKYFSRAFHSIKNEEGGLEGPLKEAREAKAIKEKEVEGLDKAMDKLHEKSNSASQSKTLRERIATKILEKSGYERELTRLEIKREFAAKDQSSKHSVAEATQTLEDLSREMQGWIEISDLQTLRGLLEHWLRKLKTFLGKEDSLKVSTTEEEESLRAKIAVLEEEIKTLRGEEERILDLQDSINKEFRAQIEEIENKKSELRVLERKLEQLGFEKEKMGLRLAEIEREWHTIGRPVHELKELVEFSGDIDLGESERRMLRLRGELAAIGEIDSNLIKEAQDTEDRFVFLERELGDLKKASEDLRNLIKELDVKIHSDFKAAFHRVNEEFNKHFQLMFGGGKAKMKIVEPEEKKTEVEVAEAEVAEAEAGKPGSEEPEPEKKMAGVEIELSLPKKKISDLAMLSGGEKSLVSLAALFALIAVSPPPFLVLDEIDAALDEENARRFSELIKNFSAKTQFIIVTHNRSTMEAADILYGVTMEDDGVSKVLSLKLEEYSETGGHKKLES